MFKLLVQERLLGGGPLPTEAMAASRHSQDGDLSVFQHLQQAELGGFGLPYSLPDVSWRKPIHPNDQRKVWEAVQNLCQAVHSVPLVPWAPHAFQEDGSVPDLQSVEECLSDLPLRPRVWPAHPGS